MKKTKKSWTWLAPLYRSNCGLQVSGKYYIDPKSVTREYLRQELVSFGIKGLLRITDYIEKFQNFLNDSYNKFTAEGN